jgi:predicted ATPase/DNA-binding SARP family transcriptional activator
MGAPLDIRVLGELAISRGGKAVVLPASKKTRALFGYLVVAGPVPQPRSRLCELFWDGPDDPRAALRWSLSKIRPLIDEPNVRRLLADREHVTFEAAGAAIDLSAVASDEREIARSSVESLQEAAALFRGELLEGLDLPDCYRFHEWCIARREAARRIRGNILATLVDRLSDRPETALGYARARVAMDPLDEVGHLATMKLLVRVGRPREALQQYDNCKRIVRAQLGRDPSRELEAARAAIGRLAGSTPPSMQRRPPLSPSVEGRPERPEATPDWPSSAEPNQPPQSRRLLVGRTVERATIAAALCDAAAGASDRVLLLAGEPGIGKTRLLGELADQAGAHGGTALFGRGFEAEMIRPYAVWIDVLRSASLEGLDEGLRGVLAPLLPELGATHGDADRNRLFDAVAKLLKRSATGRPLVVAIDDVQWLDEASSGLLHYLSRTLARTGVLIACAARTAEVDANGPVQALLRGLTREGRLARIDLAPLGEEATRELVQSVAAEADARRIFADGGGNPLFTLELARASLQDDAAASPSLDGLIAERLSRLDERATDLLPWAAALGHAFSIDTLATLAARSAADLLAALQELERHGVFRVAESTGGVGYDFAHDLVRRAAYRAMSEPRRLWVHLHVARTLEAASDPEGALASDIAHHAALAGDSAMASRAYVAAGERCLRLFAYADANRLAARGLQHVDRLPTEDGIRRRLALLAIQVHSSQWLRRPQQLEAQVSRVAAVARERKLHTEVSRAYYLLSQMHNLCGDFASAGALTLEAAEYAARSTDVETRRHQLANTGFCLALIERDLPRAEAFLQDAEAIGGTPPARTRQEISVGLGLVHAYAGRDHLAVPLLERGAELAAAEGEHWQEAQALMRVARLHLEAGRPREAVARCAALAPLVAKLSEGSEAPFVEALQALARVALGDADARAAAEVALQGLRAVDSQGHVAYVLNALAAHDAVAGRAAQALQAAQDALRCAEAVGQRNEAVVARARLAILALGRGERPEALRWLGGCSAGQVELSARARAAVAEASARIGEPPAR